MSRSHLSITRIFDELRDKPAWNVRRGVGSSVMLEFGTPHLEIREPKIPSASLPKKARTVISRRHVWIRGDWHLWIEDCSWSISAFDTTVSNHSDGLDVDEVLRSIEGQKLVSCVIDSEVSSTTLSISFDLDGKVVLSWPHRESDGTADAVSFRSFQNQVTSIGVDGVTRVTD